MAKKAVKDNPFVQFELDKKQQQTCKQWMTDLSELESVLLKAIEENYKVTIRYDDYNECFAAWMLPNDDHNENFGRILSGRGSTPFKAMRQVLYKHYMCFNGALWSTWDRGGKVDLDD